MDIVFDRWLRAHPSFGIVYYSTVSFAALTLVLPLLLPLNPDFGIPLAAILAVASAIPLAVRSSLTIRSEAIWIGLLSVFFLVLVVVFPQTVPPVPMRLWNVTFASNIDKTTLTPADNLRSDVESEQLQGALFILCQVFAPSTLPTSVRLEWKRDGKAIRVSREITLIAHDLGFQLWDAYNSETGKILPGKYEVSIRTAGNRILGVAVINVTSK